MSSWFLGLPHPAQALLATLFTWGLTALGAAMVFFFKSINRKVLDGMLGFAGGVMIAASFWSLLAPSIELAESMGLPGWLPAVVGFLAGGLFLKLVPYDGKYLGYGAGAINILYLADLSNKQIITDLSIWGCDWSK